MAKAIVSSKVNAPANVLLPDPGAGPPGCFGGLPLRQRAALPGVPLTPFSPPKQPLSENEPSAEMAYLCSAPVA